MAHLQSQQLCLASVDKQHNQQISHIILERLTQLLQILIYKAGKNKQAALIFCSSRVTSCLSWLMFLLEDDMPGHLLIGQ